MSIGLRDALGFLRTHTALVGQTPIVVPRGVMDPVLFRTGAWFAQQMAQRCQPGQRLLDLGCGSGVVGVVTQKMGARVTAVDLDLRACRAARANGIADVRQGDLFAPVQGEQFDHVCMNPPFFVGRRLPIPFAKALYGGRELEVMTAFFAGFNDVLASGGRGWMVLSELAPEALALTQRAGWNVVSEEEVNGEGLSLWTSA